MRSLLFTGVRKGNLFVADLNSASKGEFKCFNNKDILRSKFRLWHRKLLHLNFKTMNSLVKIELVRGLPQMKFCQEGLCEVCEKGTWKKASHRSKDMSGITEPLLVVTYGLIQSNKHHVHDQIRNMQFSDWSMTTLITRGCCSYIRKMKHLKWS